MEGGCSKGKKLTINHMYVLGC